MHINSAEIVAEINTLEDTINNPEESVDKAAQKVKNIFIKALGTKSNISKPKHNKCHLNWTHRYWTIKSRNLNGLMLDNKKIERISLMSDKEKVSGSKKQILHQIWA